MAQISVILACGGNSTRMGGVNKLLASLCSKPVIAYSLEVFENMEEVTEIVVSARECDKEQIESIAKEYNITKLTHIANAGQTRQESVINALNFVTKGAPLIAIHDGARPLVNAKYIRRCIHDASIFGGATLGVPVKDTIKQVEDDLITDTPDRSRLYITQTPQIFKKTLYFDAVNFALEHNLDFTDDCQLVEALGGKICMTRSDYKNIKITTIEDIAIATAMINGG